MLTKRDGVTKPYVSTYTLVPKLTDYHDKLNELLAADNSFAIVTATHILTQRTRKDDQERYQAIRLLVRLLYQRKWDKQ